MKFREREGKVGTADLSFSKKKKRKKNYLYLHQYDFSLHNILDFITKAALNVFMTIQPAP